MGPGGAMYAYSDSLYLVSDPDNMSAALAAATALYRNVGLRIGRGPGKTELILPSHCDLEG